MFLFAPWTVSGIAPFGSGGPGSFPCVALAMHNRSGIRGLQKTPRRYTAAMRHSSENLLIVEDDPEMRDLLRKVLEKEGYRVGVACDGPEALAALNRARFDLVVTDMLMPHDGGLELLAAIQRVHAAIPVIIVTAFGDWQSYSRALELGAAAFISKPLRMSELLAAVHNALAGRGAAASS